MAVPSCVCQGLVGQKLREGSRVLMAVQPARFLRGAIAVGLPRASGPCLLYGPCQSFVISSSETRAGRVRVVAEGKMSSVSTTFGTGPVLEGAGSGQPLTGGRPGVDGPEGIMDRGLFLRAQADRNSGSLGSAAISGGLRVLYPRKAPGIPCRGHIRLEWCRPCSERPGRIGCSSSVFGRE